MLRLWIRDAALRAVWIVEHVAAGEKAQRRRVPPDRLEPFGLGTHMHERDAVPVIAEPIDEVADDAAIERRIEPHPPEPRQHKSVVALGIGDAGAVPGARVIAAGIEIERAERIEDGARRDADLALANR